MVRIAVTGGIACGKSLLARFLQANKIPVCEADEIAHGAMALGAKVYIDVIKEFGDDILGVSGEIDRNKLADIVFGNRSKLEKLNNLVHPFVKTKIKSWLESNENAGESLAVVIVPLLFEAGMDKGWDAIISIGCSYETQIERLKGRGFNISQCRQRIEAQIPVDQKMINADYSIWNDEDEKTFKKIIDGVLKTIREREYGGKE